VSDTRSEIRALCVKAVRCVVRVRAEGNGRTAIGQGTGSGPQCRVCLTQPVAPH